MATNEVYTCTSCGYDNPEKSKKCNNCFTSFYKESTFGSDWINKAFIRRWICDCGWYNVIENNSCAACTESRKGKKEPNTIKNMVGVVIMGIGGIIACMALAGGNIILVGVGTVAVYGGYKMFKA